MGYPAAMFHQPWSSPAVAIDTAAVSLPLPVNRLVPQWYG